MNSFSFNGLKHNNIWENEQMRVQKKPKIDVCLISIKFILVHWFVYSLQTVPRLWSHSKQSFQFGFLVCQICYQLKPANYFCLFGLWSEAVILLFFSRSLVSTSFKFLSMNDRIDHIFIILIIIFHIWSTHLHSHTHVNAHAIPKQIFLHT